MLKYVQAFVDRHGKERHYFRRPGCKRVALPGEPHSRAYMEAYFRAMEAEPLPKVGKEAAGTFGALVAAYYATPAFTNLRDSTKRGYRVSLEPFRTSKYGAWPVRGAEAQNIELILDELTKTPASRELLRKRLRQVLQLGVRRKWCDFNPVLGVEIGRRRVEGFAPWSEADIAAFEARWPSGCRERLALALLLYTGQRRSDVVGMGRQHVREGRIHVRQLKTDKRLAIRIHPRLQVEIDAMPKDQMTFVQTEYGKPFSAAGFTAWFVGRAVLAGLPGRSPHGLRKAAGRRLAEAGCTAHEIMAVLGHESLQEAERYTKSANQALLSDSAIQKSQNVNGDCNTKSLKTVKPAIGI